VADTQHAEWDYGLFGKVPCVWDGIVDGLERCPKDGMVDDC
jgi:hypothetical protein